jgi:TPR repeat protein
MPICRTLIVSALGLAMMTAGPLAASDLVASRSGSRPGSVPDAYSSAKDALRSGVRNYNAGDKAAAVKALEYAADQGYALASWKLGRMYAEGDGVPRDDLKAFEYFSRIADENADEAPDSPRAGVVASAFVALGTYFLEGIKNTSVVVNPEKAAELYLYAASYFGDPNAQYSLAQLYLNGSGVERDERQAARWFNLAAEKGHPGAQALLGRMLLNGQGVPRERARGLMWLMLAKEAADPKRDAWIWTLHSEAFDAASETDRKTATAFAERYQTRRR